MNQSERFTKATRDGETMPYAMKMMYTDIEPFEIVRRVSPKCLEIRPMRAKRLDKPVMVPGGFSAHCTNNHEIRYDITPNPEAKTIRIRLHKIGTWQDKHGNKYSLGEQPVYFYDYNF